MVESTYITIREAISWIAFKDFSAHQQFSQYQANKVLIARGLSKSKNFPELGMAIPWEKFITSETPEICKKIDDCFASFLEHLRAGELSMKGEDENGNPHDIPANDLIRDDIYYDIEFGFMRIDFRLYESPNLKDLLLPVLRNVMASRNRWFAAAPQWSNLKVNRRDIIRLWPNDVVKEGRGRPNDSDALITAYNTRLLHKNRLPDYNAEIDYLHKNVSKGKMARKIITKHITLKRFDSSEKILIASSPTNK